jgi:hypothetical protein
MTFLNGLTMTFLDGLTMTFLDGLTMTFLDGLAMRFMSVNVHFHKPQVHIVGRKLAQLAYNKRAGLQESFWHCPELSLASGIARSRIQL